MTISKVIVCPKENRIWGCYISNIKHLQVCETCLAVDCSYKRAKLEFPILIPIIENVCADCFERRRK